MAKVRLRTRFVASFLAVALIGVGTLAILTLALLPGRLTRLVVERQDAAAARAGRVLERAYVRHGAWSPHALGRAGAFAAEAGGTISVTTAASAAPSPSPATAAPSPARSGQPSATASPTPAGQSGAGPGEPGGNPSPSPSGRAEGGGDGSQGSGGSPTPAPSPTAQTSGQHGSGGSGGAGSGSGSGTSSGSSSGTSSGSSSGGSGVGGSGQGLAAAGPDGRTVEVPIVVDGTTVGTLTVTYPSDSLPAPERDLEASLRWAILIASAVAIAAALGVSLVIARRLDRPISRLTRAARRLGGGDLSARAGSDRAPGEVGELAATFDQMAEALAREDEVRRVLVADVTHELRTPVTILRASLEELVDGTAEPEIGMLSSLHDEVLRLSRILQDLGALAEAQAAGLEMRVQPVDLAQVTGGVIDRLRPSFATAEVEPHADLAPATVLGDRDRLDQVVTNLLTNAMKFTPPGGDVSVRVATLNGDARLEVIDSGGGIPQDELPHVFERFWRGRAGRSTSGSGVGLAVVAELVRAHHGTVEAANAPGKGASFRVILPRA